MPEVPQGAHYQLNSQLINTTINAGQFAGLPSEDPLAHLRKFLRIADTARFNGTPLNITRLSLFPFSLMGKAYDWIAGLPDNSITTWEECTTKFLNKYFPPGRTSQMKNEIFGFRQFEQEPLAEAWERFQDPLRRCPHHGLQKGQLVQHLYSELSSQNRMIIDAACRGTILNKVADEAYNIIEDMASNHYQLHGDRHVVKKPAEVNQVQSSNSSNIENKLDTLTRQMEMMMKAQAQLLPPQSSCEQCGQTGHTMDNCHLNAVYAEPREEANYVSNQGRNNSNSFSNPFSHQ